MKLLRKLKTSRVAFFMAAMILLFASCNKDNKELLVENDLEQIVELTNQAYLQSDVTGGDENSPIYLPNDGLVEEYLAREGDLLQKNDLIPNRLIRCLLATELSDEQYALTRRALLAYETRNKRLIANHRATIANMKSAFEDRRNYLIGQLRSGEITPGEFRAKMMELRRRFLNAVTDLKNSNAGAFRASFQLFLEHLNTILDDEQWQAFTGCIRNHLAP